MSEDVFLAVLQNGLMITAKLLTPLLLISTVVGLLVGLFQSVTQINEMTLTFIPKIVVVGLVLMLLGPWMLASIMDFSRELILSIPSLLQH